MIEGYLKRFLKYKDIGWKEHNETFLRFVLLSTPWFKVYIHKLNCPSDPIACHDHPWHFWTLVVKNGYWERTPRGTKYMQPGTIAYRPARYNHTVWTKGDAWSVIVVSPKVREWSPNACIE